MTSDIKVWGLEPQEIEAIVQKGVARRRLEAFAAGRPWPTTRNDLDGWEWADGSFTKTKKRPHGNSLVAAE